MTILTEDEETTFEFMAMHAETLLIDRVVEVLKSQRTNYSLQREADEMAERVGRMQALVKKLKGDRNSD